MKDTLVRPSYRSARQAALMAACVVLAACGARDPAEPPPRPAPTVEIQPDAHAVAWTSPGVIAAPESTPLSFRQAGLVLRRHAGLGEAVRAGQVLAELDPAPWRQNLASAQARYEAARVARDVAERQWRRDRAQGSEGLLAQAQAEQTRGQWAQARAEFEQASQALAHARDQMVYTRLTAGHDGVIVAEQAAAGQNVAAGQPVYTLAWGDGLEVVVDLPERRVAGVELGQAAEVEPVARPGVRLTARVREIARAADPASLGFRVKLRLDAPDPALRLGMTATVRFLASAAAGARYTLPATALFHQGDRPAVWVLDDQGALALRTVEVAAYGTETVTLSAGVAPGQIVLAQGAHTVSEGQRVEAVPYQPRAAAPGGDGQ
ncbi:efflux RND transporter periplasmic adaptor subunit [Castellaniella ginsengisoli]|uniref:Efflux RND transporter periplasmic adaptor subunit n=1 Tax=Castellaniella ginsengisoli TaxID=546114 RepID=A0AB39E1A8_9BURK